MGTAYTKKVSVIGHFHSDILNGQTIKTEIVTEELEKALGKDQLRRFDTSGNKYLSLLKSPFLCFSALKASENVCIFPEHKGLRVLVPLLSIGNCLLHRKLHYVVIGGWLPEFLQKHWLLRHFLKRFRGIYVEAVSMKNALELLGLTNVFLFPNFKNIRVLSKDELVYNRQKPYRLCTFARVMKEKGQEDAIRAVEEINRERGEIVYTLDIYGSIFPEYLDRFNELQKTFPPYIRYQGVAPFDQTTAVIQNYFALLFPTYYEWEGFAGTLIDAFTAGVPVIATDWRYNPEIITDGKTGLLFETGHPEQLKKILQELAEAPDTLHRMKENCLQKATEFTPDTVMKTLLDNL